MLATEIIMQGSLEPPSFHQSCSNQISLIDELQDIPANPKALLSSKYYSNHVNYLNISWREPDEPFLSGALEIWRDHCK